MRKIWDIHGGVHPPENKEQSLQRSLQQAGIAPQLILPLSQHIGAPASPVVTVGQKVLKGQLIAEAKGFVSAPVHAPTSGTVSAIEARVIPHPSGMSAPCIIIDSDGKDEWLQHQGEADFRSLSKTELLQRIRDAGIAGMGGAGFPSAVKLSTRDEKPIDTLILNGTECEPYITADDVLMQERAQQIIAGAEILRHLIQPTNETVIGVEDNKPAAITALQRAAQGTGIEIVSFPTKYPSGGEKQLIEILTGREVPSSGLPADIGVVCQNIGTAVAIYRAICHGEPLISRITTVTGNACRQPGNFEVLLGTPVQYLLEQAGFEPEQCLRLVMGGPMMGYTLQDPAVPVVKTSNCILAPTVEELPPPPPAQACIRCGMCSEACPVSLLPQQMYWFARAQEHDKLEEHNLFDCIECGACSYVCPSHIPLVQYYRAAKGEIRQAQQDRIKAERSKERFEARQARIEKEEAEKEARRKARLEAARAKTGGDGKTDVIQAAIERSQAKKSANTDPAQAVIARAQAARSGPPQDESNEARNNAQSPAEADAGDPAQAAIARAQAKRAGKGEETAQQKQQRLEKLVASNESKLETSREKLRLAREQDDNKAEAFSAAVDNLSKKLNAAKAELEAHLAQHSPVQAAQADDPASAAIARAMAARQANAAMSETDKLKQTIESLENRIAKSRDKLRQAQQSGDDNAEILAQSLAKLESKLADSQQQLAKQGANP